MKIREIIKEGQEKLEAAGKDGAAFDARALLSFVTDIPFRDMPLHYSDEVPDEQKAAFLKLVERRAGGEPLQYLTGEQEFMGLDFHVDSRVLIPRLDTEILAETALDLVKKKTAEGQQKPLRILDLCCGSGAIGLSVASLAPSEGQECRLVTVLADIDEGALEVAEENAARLGLADRVAVIQSDLFDGIRDMRFDLITANPPYIRSEVIETLDDEVKRCEPRLALDGGPDGLDMYRRIIAEAPDHLEDGGCLMMEIGSDQAEDIERLLRDDGRYSDVAVRKDLAGLDRVATVKVKKQQFCC